MENKSGTAGSTVIPGMRYRNAMAMIDWLCNVFGFEKHSVHADPNGVVMHAQLTLGNGMIMLGSVDNGSQASSLSKQPDEVDGKETQSPYLVLTDCDLAYERAKNAGARILMELEGKDYGGKGFCCADPEGHIWHVGTYDPWATQPD